MILLNQAEIQRALNYGQAIVFTEINSTNEYLLNHHNQLPSGSVCLAETQTAGRGRRGRKWYSPLSKNLYFSMLWRYSSINISQIAPLSLVVAIVIAETFQQLNVQDIQIKWPNDIYYQGKKMGGILIESRANRHSIDLVIGIGLNLSMNAIDPSIVNQAWSDLSNYQLDRNNLAALLAQRLQKMLVEFPQHTFSDYLPQWNQFDLFYKKPVKLLTEKGEIHGIANGINNKGELLLEQDNKMTPFAIGEISLRPDN
ncbi:biotin--[acetyl-CoA-carboxylase] ligase [Otariodibacter oris]|uniref:biotin--[biotin carboxyl-carrier protein] ligase n=1 Tax=Otariodibacter oris TaxID=1032623 RepID=A0A420XEW6_9PAST|nr:biotin--[acetyl-CoA-carboxylase] ligase [Otariodibacter oris]RKR70609.1 BirA family biotin operon repressor/biotin-[acetyl-CoA-carboxylase] ligase [Otariodibacter oris]